jgi:hypothetical protein
MNAEGVQYTSLIGKVLFLNCDLIAFLRRTTSSKTITCLVRPAKLLGLVSA